MDQTGPQTIRDNISPLVLVELVMKMVFIAGFVRGSDGEKSLEPACAYAHMCPTRRLLPYVSSWIVLFHCGWQMGRAPMYHS